MGLTPFDIQLPDEDSPLAPLEGALWVRADGASFVLETVDYGQAFRLLAAESEPQIKQAVLGYVSRPLPPVRVRAAITPPWFGRPGGGIRFTLQQPETGLRDLVVSGRLQRIHITG